MTTYVNYKSHILIRARAHPKMQGNMEMWWCPRLGPILSVSVKCLSLNLRVKLDPNFIADSCELGC